jgi:GT2 family glycosyltransferase
MKQIFIRHSHSGRAASDAIIRSVPPAPLVVSVVVNFSGFDDTIRCVESLLASAYGPHAVVVVDNASPSGDAARLSVALGDRIHLIASATNLGYGGGANLGLRWATAHEAAYAWVLNNDTIVEPTCVGRLVDAMESNPVYGVLSPQISAPIGPEAPDGIWFAGGEVLLARAETRHVTDRLDGGEIIETGYITGCAMFLRCASLTDTGLFWEPLFLYWEDLDLSLRIRRLGWNLGVLPDARIRHEIHGSVGSQTLDYYHFRNALVIVRTFGSWATAAAALLFLAGGVVRRWARALLRRTPAPTGATRGFLVGIWLAVRWPTSLAGRAQLESRR